MKHHPDVASLRARVLPFPIPDHLPTKAEIVADFMRRLEDEIEGLIDLLDELRGDADAEPVLGWPETDGYAAGTLGSDDEREIENEHGGNVEDEGECTLGWTTTGDIGLTAEGESEPSLGWTVTGYIGGGDDREDGDRDMEPDLGWEAGSEPYSQTLLIATDYEDDNDSGIADLAALESTDIPFFPETRRRNDEERRQEREIFDAARRLAWTRMGRDPDTVTLLGPGLRFERRF